MHDKLAAVAVEVARKLGEEVRLSGVNWVPRIATAFSPSASRRSASSSPSTANTSIRCGLFLNGREWPNERGLDDKAFRLAESLESKDTSGRHPGLVRDQRIQEPSTVLAQSEDDTGLVKKSRGGSSVGSKPPVEGDIWGRRIKPAAKRFSTVSRPRSSAAKESFGGSVANTSISASFFRFVTALHRKLVEKILFRATLLAENLVRELEPI